MSPHTRNPFDTRHPAKPDTADFLDALGDSQAAASYRQAMGEDASPSTPDDHGQELTPDGLARLQAIQDRERARERVELRKREYLAWAQEFNLGDDDPQAWLDATFIFNPYGTVEVDGNLDLSNKSIIHLPPALIRVNGNLYLWGNELTSLKGLPQEIHGDLDLSNSELTSLYGLPQEIHGDLDISYNHLTSLDELKGKKIDGHLCLNAISAQCIPEGINLVGKVYMNANQTALKEDATKKGYTVREE